MNWLLACAALAGACAAPEDAEDSSAEAGKLDDLREDGSTFFVYANGRVCVTTPCPIYTAITPGAVRFDVSELDVDRLSREDIERIHAGGMLVRGGFDGDVLWADKALAAPEEFLIWRHPDGPGFTALTIAGDRAHPDNIDLEGLPTPGKRVPTLAGLVEGEWTARGFLARSDTGVTTLFATGVAGWSWPCTVFASGIECVTAPCPTFSMVAPDGEWLGNAASIDLQYLRFDADRELALRTRIATGAADVYAWIAHGEWDPGERGDVLYVIGLDADDDGGDW